MSGEDEFHNHLNLPGLFTVIAPHSCFQTIILEHSHVATALMSSQFHALQHTLSESSPQPTQNMQRKFNQRNIFVNEQLRLRSTFFFLTIRLNDPLYVEVSTMFTTASPKPGG